MQLPVKFGRSVFKLGLAIAPAIVLAYFLVQNTVNVPLLDEWVIARLLPQIAEGSATFSDFFRQFNEHRIFFPRLIIAGLAFLTGWDIRYQNLFAFLLVCVISLNLNRLRQATLKGINQNQSLILLVLTNLLIFSLAQWENWLVGLYLKYFIPIACLALGITICYGSRKTIVKVLICGILAIISTFSIANGILLWLLFLPLLFANRTELTQNYRLVIIWLVAFGLNLYFYFGDYRSPYSGFNWFYPLSHPIAVLHYFLVFLGSPFAFGTIFSPVAIATTVGLSLVLAFGFVCNYVYRNPNLWRNSSGWLAIAFYSLGSDLVVAIGRIYSGVDQALTSRYSTFAVYFVVALLHLLSLVIIDFRLRYHSQPRVINFTIVFSLTLLLFLHTQTAIVSTQIMSQLRTERLYGKACLQLINLIDTSECIKSKINPKPIMVKERANRISQFGFLNPPLLNSQILIDQTALVKSSADKQKDDQYGSFERLKELRDHSYMASGWAILSDRNQPADAVLLAYQNDQGESVLFQIIGQRLTVKDIANSQDKEYVEFEWEESINLQQIPQKFLFTNTNSGTRLGKKLNLTAWAYDTETGKSFRLKNTFSFTLTPIADQLERCDSGFSKGKIAPCTGQTAKHTPQSIQTAKSIQYHSVPL